MIAGHFICRQLKEHRALDKYQKIIKFYDNRTLKQSSSYASSPNTRTVPVYCYGYPSSRIFSSRTVTQSVTSNSPSIYTPTVSLRINLFTIRFFDSIHNFLQLLLTIHVPISILL